jgi:hypothetical protein
LLVHLERCHCRHKVIEAVGVPVPRLADRPVGHRVAVSGEDGKRRERCFASAVSSDTSPPGGVALRQPGD